jgi:hypothetical protein
MTHHVGAQIGAGLYCGVAQYPRAVCWETALRAQNLSTPIRHLGGFPSPSDTVPNALSQKVAPGSCTKSSVPAIETDQILTNEQKVCRCPFCCLWSSVNPNLWVRWEYARRRCSSGLGCLVSTTRCHVPGFAHTFGLHQWIADGRDGQCDWAFKHQNR